MPVFSRRFPTDTFSTWYATNPNSAVHELFKRWALPGTPAVDGTHLRLAVRGGYLNFYVKGQSAAKLSWSETGPRVSVHSAYVDGRMKGTEYTSGEPGQVYVEYGPTALADPATAGLVAGWVQTAESYASAEKRFVDELVAANPGTIDLEMGLPAGDLPGSERVAPRMDLVVVQIAGADTSIAFWEAKCANNGEVRAKGDAAPKVLGQIRRYADWMATETRVAEVQQAYRTSAEVLLDLHRLVGGKNQSKAECIRYWSALASTEAAHVVIQPGVVIGNYWPEGSTERIASERMRQCARSFEKNEHRQKLERAGIRLHQVGPDRKDPRLPLLEDRTSA